MLFENESEQVHLCHNCDSEYTVTKIDDEEGSVEFCPFCGEAVYDEDQFDEDLLEDE